MHWTVWGTGEIKEGKSVSGMAKWLEKSEIGRAHV
jgi:hypothetical protein